MCHAMTTRNRPCRNKTARSVRLTSDMGCRQTFSTGLCAGHAAELDRDHIIALWRPIGYRDGLMRQYFRPARTDELDTDWQE